MSDPSAAVDDAIRAFCEAGRWRDAATLWIETRGPEVLTFLVSIGGAHADPHELFAEFCEALWRGLPGFRWECSTRTWSYRVARYVWIGALKREKRRLARLVPLSSEVADVAERVRTTTAIHARSEVKNRFTALREHLAPDDRMLLLLRVDRNLEWHEVARVMMEEGTTRNDDLARVSARLRKQFQRVKDRLRELAAAEGLLPEG